MSACASLAPMPNELRAPAVPAQWQNLSTTTESKHIELPDELKSIISQAFETSPDLLSLQAKLKASNAQVVEAGADRWPQLFASTAAAYSKPQNTTSSREYTLGLSSSWEIDIWRRLSTTRYAAVLSAQASEADYQAGKLLLAANIARIWAQAISQQQLLTLIQASVDTYKQSLVVIQDQVLAGLSSPLDLRLLRSQAASSRAQLAAANTDLADFIAQLQVLLGAYPSGSMVLSESYGPLPSQPNASIPVQLLEQRPDLQAAQLRYYAQVKTAAVAGRNWLPDLSINANITQTSSHWSELLELDNLVRNITANLVGKLFQGGRLKAQHKRQRAIAEQLAADYAGLALNAFKEIEINLVTDYNLNNQQQQLAIASTEAKEAASIAFDQYRLGLADVVTLLEAQRSAFDTERTLLINKAQLWLNRINLYQALGQPFYQASSEISATESQNIDQ